MAGDWIKFESTTPDKPEVVRIAAILGIDQDAVVGKLLRFWVWADQNSVDGNGVTVTSAFLDRLTFCPGFASAMRDVSWLEGGDGNLSLPNFGLHNGKTAKERAVSGRRVAKHRNGNGESNGDVTPRPLQKPLPEKRREEKDQEQLQGSDKLTLTTPDEPKGKNGKATKKPVDADPICQIILEAYHAALPACQAVRVLNPKRKRRMLAANKLAGDLIKQQGLGIGVKTFWRDYFAECSEDDWLAGRVPYAGNPGWKQNLDTLLEEDRFAKIMDKALASAGSGA